MLSSGFLNQFLLYVSRKCRSRLLLLKNSYGLKIWGVKLHIIITADVYGEENVQESRPEQSLVNVKTES